MNAGLKLLLAALSGVLVALVFETDMNLDWIPNLDWLPITEDNFSNVAFYGLTGLLFAAGVLSPYLSRKDLFSWRSIALVLISGVSFYFAVLTAIELPSKWGPEKEDFIIVSLVGAAIVLLPAPFLLRIKFSLTYVVLGVVAAIAGGFVFGWLEDLFRYGWLLRFGAWHLLMGMALHFANPSAADERCFARVKGWRLKLIVGVPSLLIVLPLADDSIGAWLQYRHTSHDGEFRLHHSVSAHGFRDMRKKPMFKGANCDFGCITMVRTGVYAFQEYVVDDPAGRFEAIFVGHSDDPNCLNYSGKAALRSDVYWQGDFAFNDSRCLTHRLVDQPVAEFGIRESVETVRAGFGMYRLSATHRQVVRLNDDAIVADATYFIFRSRFFNEIFGRVGTWGEILEEGLPPATGEWQPPD